MQHRKVIAALEKRAFKARVPLYELARRAGISPAVFSRVRDGAVPRVRTIARLETAMAEIEAERR